MSKETATQYYNEGLRQVNRQDWHKALEYLRNAIAEDSSHVNSYNALGMIYMRQGCITTARKYWAKAMKIDPDNVTAKQCLLALNVRTPRVRIRNLLWTAVFGILLISLISSNLFWLHNTRGLPNVGGLVKAIVHKSQGSEAENQDELRPIEQESKPIELEIQAATLTTPSQVSAIYDEARADCNAGRYDSAISKFRHILEHPSSHDLKDNAQYWLGECYYAQGEYAQALTEFQKVKENYPGANKVFDSELKIAYTYCRMGYIEQARQKLLQISREFPDEKYQANIATLSEKIQSVQPRRTGSNDKDSTAYKPGVDMNSYAHPRRGELLSDHTTE